MRHSPAAIRRFLTQHAASSHTIAAFCADHGLKVATFYAWKRKYGPPAAATVSGGFYQLCPTAPTGAAWSLRLPSGLRLELSGLSPRELAHLLLELERGAHA
ncbi:IS66 family insertion sequence element accessory protein TnpA [Neolewinella sp.]|uniref:IS66 family insertion sequence element accessory protein TnpA n=1 Tax=Neolewinella sp. TaxID=2993543 RepID=UPI003B520FC1